MTSDSLPPVCPSCASITAEIGKIPRSVYFAGQRVNRSYPETRLYRCLVCHLDFRWPRPGKDVLDQLYRNAGPEAWSGQAGDRADWFIARNWLSSNIGRGSILDVGCYDGSYLDSLGNAWSKSGIEINPTAAKIAEQKGIEIVGNDVEGSVDGNRRFTVVTAFDVVEHLSDPFAFLRSLQALCEPNGIIIISTGDSRALTWKWMGSRYWYCTIPEHLSFVNRSWLASAVRKLSLRTVLLSQFSHAGIRPGRIMQAGDLVKNAVYALSPRFFAYLRKHGFGRTDVSDDPDMALLPPFWMSSNDHFLAILRT